MNLTKQLKLSDMEALFWSIQTGVATDSDNPVENLRQYVLPELPTSDGIYEKIVSGFVLSVQEKYQNLLEDNNYSNNCSQIKLSAFL